ncbi:sugar phosphate isomerase/epimerase family protein [Paenibacillus agricola]|uniref:TIM barrel protein n=1 Tax=Paenibacillus agricola TaxID=2716264 RepID=A0ABX0JGV9_9BACL|nr:sugar phosphate isomerase/epimerase [Paenibacillus agricola]NHN35031.1 TIM barrel protein [Paenibacillus agricola]
MKLGYHTNTWGGVVGHPAGVTSIKDLFYLTNGSNEEALTDIHLAGYTGVELFDGNLVQYVNEPEKFKELLDKNQTELVAVYSGANFIYKDILDDELWRINEAAKMAKLFGAEHLVVGGGAIRASGIVNQDYLELAKGLERVAKIAEDHGLIASYHPHLGTIGQAPEQIERIFEYTSIHFCPDTAHLVAGGANLINLARKYIDRIKYVHYKDYADGSFLPLGKGALPLKELTDLLTANGYNGWITVELDAYDGHPKDAAVISKQYLDSVLRNK